MIKRFLNIFIIVILSVLAGNISGYTQRAVSLKEYNHNLEELKFNGFEFSFLKPSGVLGFCYKPTLGFDYVQMYTSRYVNLRLGWALGLYTLIMRSDSIPTYGVLSSVETTILPGYEKTKFLVALPFRFVIEYRMLEGSFHPVVGCDILATTTAMQYESVIYNYKRETITGLTASIGVFPKIGVLYEQSDKILLTGGIGKVFSYDLIFVGKKMWKVYFGVLFKIESK